MNPGRAAWLQAFDRSPLQQGANPIFAGASLIAGLMIHRLAHPLHLACMKDGGFERACCPSRLHV